MKKLGKELEFISLVKRDGSGTIAVGTEWNADSDYPKTDDMSYLDDEEFEIRVLSITQKTYIASGFNTWVVRLKEQLKIE
jgi:hypothetical protein